MALASVALTVKNAGLIQAYRKQLAATPQQTVAIVGKTVNRVADRALTRFRQPGSPVTYPLRWQSERQRKAFFASNGFGAGIPYRRTGRLENGWKLTVIYEADRIPAIALTNPVQYRKFVVGRFQQRMHKGRWYIQSTVTRQVQKDLASEVESALIRDLYVSEAIANG